MRRALESFGDRVLDDLRNPRVLVALIVLILAIAAAAVFLPKAGTVDQSEVTGGAPVGGVIAGSRPVPVSRHTPSIGAPVPYGVPDPFRPTAPRRHKSTGASKAATTTTMTTGSGSGKSKHVFTFARGATANLAFGVPDRTLTKYDNTRGNTPFPAASNVAVMFIGVLADANTAVFLASKGTVATGVGKCLPSRIDCQYFELSPGQQEQALAQQHGGGSKLYVIKYFGPGKTESR